MIQNGKRDKIGRYVMKKTLVGAILSILFFIIGLSAPANAENWEGIEWNAYAFK